MQQNVANVVLGNLHIKPWYPSFYPEDLVGGRKAEWLYVCQWCFRYTHEIMKYSAHCVSGVLGGSWACWRLMDARKCVR